MKYQLCLLRREVGCLIPSSPSPSQLRSFWGWWKGGRRLEAGVVKEGRTGRRRQDTEMGLCQLFRGTIPTLTCRMLATSVDLSSDVRRRIREIMVRSVLLARHPLTVEGLINLVQETCILQNDTPMDQPQATQHTGGGYGTPSSSSPTEQHWLDGTTNKRGGYVKNLADFLMTEASSQTRAVPSPRKVQPDYIIESTVRLLLAVDPQFRVSVGGFVCYPNLPSLITASTSVERDERYLYSMQHLVREEEDICAAAMGLGTGNAAKGSTVSGTNRGAQLHEWSYILSLWCMLDCFVDGSEEHHLKRGRCAQVVQHHKGDGCRKERTLSERLTELWISAYDLKDLPPLLRENSSTEDWFGAPPYEFKENMEGNDALRRWCTETREGYVNDLLLEKAVITPAAKSVLQQVNFHMAYLFNLIVAVPITIGRLSTLVQWESHPFAMHYRSFLHFVILFTGCSAVLQMERYEMRRRDVRKRWRSLLWTQVREEWNRQRHDHLTRRFASQSLNSETCEAESTNKTQTTAGPATAGNYTKSCNGNTRWASWSCPGATQYHFWVSSTSGPTVSPKFADVCRCVFLRSSTGVTPLDVTSRSPSEVMDEFATVSKENKWDEGEANNDIFVFAVSPFVLEHRVCRVVKLWWLLEGRHAGGNCSREAVITVRGLSQLCLWEHEYGAVVASRMMLHYLRSFEFTEGTMRLLPPSKESSSGDDAGEWLVVVPLVSKTSNKTE